MPIFLCKIGTADGRVVTRKIQGVSEAELRRTLGEQGFYVFSLRRVLSFWSSQPTAISNRDLLQFNQEFLVLFRSGLPIVRILETLIRRCVNGRLRMVLGDILAEVKGGAPLSDAFSSAPGFFPYLYLAAIKAGERSGDIPETLGRFQAYQRRMEEVRAKVRNAASYPVFLLGITLILLVGLLTYVVPRFAEIYADAGSQLPLLTRLIMGASEISGRMFPVVLLLLIAGLPILKYLLRSRVWRYRIDRFLLRTPFLGELLTEYALARFSRTLGTILSSGMPVVEGIRMAKGTLNNRYFEAEIERANRRIEEGGRFTESLEETGIFPVIAIGMLDAGETAGSLDTILFDVASYYDNEVEQHLDRLTRRVEPLMFLLVGGIVAFVVVGMYLPIFHLAEISR